MSAFEGVHCRGDLVGSMHVHVVEVSGVDQVGQHALEALVWEGVRVAGGLGEIHRQEFLELSQQFPILIT